MSQTYKTKRALAQWRNPEFVYHPADSHRAGVQEFYQRQIARGLVPRKKREADTAQVDRLIQEGRL